MEEKSLVTLINSSLEPGSLEVNASAAEAGDDHSLRRAVYIYPRLIKALNNPTRRKILVLLFENGTHQMSFTEIKRKLDGVKNASLSRHMAILQRAWLVERSVELSSPRTAKDPYYSFYTISQFGGNVLSRFANAVAKSALSVSRQG